jgi:DNA-binding response OmpR family regulator
MSDQTAVLVAERDDALRDQLIDQFSADRFHAEPARSVAEVRCRAARGPDLLLLGELEQRLADLALLRAIRTGDTLAGRIDPALPVIVLASEEGDWAPLRAFQAGCDDFIRKPVRYLELCARVRAVLRRCSPGHGRRSLRVGGLVIEHAGREVRYAGRPVELSRMEWALLTHLAGDPLRVFTKQELLHDVWGYRAEGSTRTVDAHACRLRRKLERAGALGHLQNLRGVGYRLVDRTAARIVDQDQQRGATPNAGGSLIERLGARRAA